ncbi:MAG: SCO family protein [Parvibaculaceae bacterium]
MTRRTQLVLVFAAAVALTLAGVAATFLFRETGEARTSGKALVGGPFTLTSQNGEKVSDAQFRGHYMLVAFGYTYCPDVCPAELQVMSAALDQLGAKADEIQPIFITIDPERDTVPVLKDYMSHFHSRFVGLTGTPEEIAAAARAYRVYYGKAKDSGTTDYLMDHSSIIYLMGKDGAFLKHFPYGTDAKALADGIVAAANS